MYQCLDRSESEVNLSEVKMAARKQKISLLFATDSEILNTMYRSVCVLETVLCKAVNYPITQALKQLIVIVIIIIIMYSCILNCKTVLRLSQ